VSEVLEVGQGHAIRYLGNYDDYLAKKAAMEARERAGVEAGSFRGGGRSSHAHEARTRQVTHPKMSSGEER